MSYYRDMISFISIAHAVESTAGQAEAHRLVGKINDVILFPLIALMMALAFIYFLYGAYEFVRNANNDAARETGRNHLMYGVIGMLVMLSAMAILQIAAGTFDLEGELDAAKTDSTGNFSSFAPTAASVTGRRPAGLAERYSAVLNGDDAAIAPGMDTGTPLTEAVLPPESDSAMGCSTVIINGVCIPSETAPGMDTGTPLTEAVLPPSLLSDLYEGSELDGAGLNTEVSGLALIVAEMIAAGWNSDNAIIVGRSYAYYTDRDKAYESLTVLVEQGTITARSRDQFLEEKFDSN